MTSSVEAKGLVLALVHQLGSRAWLYCNCEAVKASIDGRPAEELGVGGLEWRDLTPGAHEITLGEAKNERKLGIQSSAARSPTVTAFVFAK